MPKVKLNLDELRVEGFDTMVEPTRDAVLADEAATLVCSEKRSCGHICP